LAGHQAPIRALAFSHDGQLIASGGEDTRIILWDAASGAISKILSGSSGAVSALIFNPKSPSLISATETGEISIWNVATGRRMFIFTVPI
jgi:WD40 repeat protein